VPGPRPLASKSPDVQLQELLPLAKLALKNPLVPSARRPRRPLVLAHLLVFANKEIKEQLHISPNEMKI